MVAKSYRFAVLPILAGLLLGGGVVAYRAQHSVTSASPAAPARAGSLGTQGALVISTDRLNFGPLDSERAVVRQILLRNTASQPVHVVVGDPGTGLSVDTRNLALAPGALGRIAVTAAPGSGPIRGELRIATAEDPARTYLVALEGGASHSGAPTAAADGDADCREASCSVAQSELALEPGSVLLTRAGTDPVSAASAPRAYSPTTPQNWNGAPPTVGLTRTPGEIQRGPERATGAPNTPVALGEVPARSLSDRASSPTSDRAQDGETPEPIRRPRREDPGGDPKEDPKPTTPGVLVLDVSPSSTVTLMGTTNQFYPQQVGVLGSSTGGTFSLSSALRVPRIPLAFGQSMEFSQQGSAVGSFDAASGQVNISLPLQAVDSTGKAAPVVLALTTGTVVTRNSNGVLVSTTGTPRSASGSLRLVGIGKIPTGYRNGAEEQLVLVEILGTLSLSNPSLAQSAAPGAASGM